MDEDDDFPKWGVYNTAFVLKAALYWVPRMNLYYAICKVVDYLDQRSIEIENDEGPGPDVEEVFDILFQTATTGQYTPIHLEGDEHPTPLSEEEIEREAQKFRDLLKGLQETREPDQKDGHDGDH